MSRRLRFHLSVDGLARTRLAHSPLWEAVFSLRAVADPAASTLHEPWAVAARSRLDGIDVDTLLALWTPCAAVPDFLTPPPVSSRPQFDEELRRVRKTPPEQIRRDLQVTYRDALPPGLESVYRRPGSGIDRLVRLLGAYWERALADHWPRLRLVLEGDVVYRTRALAAGGAMAVFDDLHERVAWESGDVVIGSPEAARGPPGRHRRPRAPADAERLHLAVRGDDVPRALRAGGRLSVAGNRHALAGRAGGRPAGARGA